MESNNKKIRIGLTFTEARHENYPTWIQGSDADIEIVELHWDKHSMEEVWDEVEDCHGIVLSGGVDVHPDFYENERTEYPNGPKSQEEFNKERDEFEMHVFETALNFDKPTSGGSSCKGTWYSVGRLNYSLQDRKLVDTVVGLEYDSCCWIGRVVLERLQSSVTTSNTRLLFQIEFVGFSRLSLGSSPLDTFKQNVPRYQNLREQVTTPSRFSNYD